ncbi:hypothetical protein BAUCODRAFT_42625, partial [Baudoinia panamericana UAMH 10762]
IDMRSLEYALPPDENLMCPICRCPYVDPVVLAECDHCFCRDCIRQSWASTYNPMGPRGDCPTCRTPAKLGLRSSTNRILTNILDDLLVQCPKSEDGCTAVVKRGEVLTHINIYCGYALQECTGDDCELPIRRKEAPRGCQHYGVSCIDCHESMYKSNLELHWRSMCPDRRVRCDLCKGDVFYRELDVHSKETCPAISIPCPGAGLGCTSRSKRSLAEVHAKSCTFAKLAPVIAAQSQRMDEHEAAQRVMGKKLEVLETGFAAMEQIFAGPESGFQPNNRMTANPLPVRSFHEALPTEFDTAFPPPAANGPYTSPLHHLLSMHESLRDEMSRMSSALSELDGRHSMATLNENLRTREEISYLGAQVAGLSRQVHWLTSAQLQRQ